MPATTLRPVRDDDLEAVLALNLAEVPRVAPMDEDRCAQIRGIADRFDVIEVDGRFGGFVVTVAPGTSYDSQNYRWFGERFGDRFYYLDRVAIDPSARRKGVGGAAYDEIESVAAAYDRLTLEVNLIPPNSPSLAFHLARGFAEVGQLGDSDHLVSLLAKELGT